MRQTFREWLKEKEIIEAEQINEMEPTYALNKTGVRRIYLDFNKMASHGPRIKVYDKPKGKNFSVTISDKPKVVTGDCFVNNKELKRIFAFIIKYEKHLIGYWNSELTTEEMEQNIFH